MRLVIGYTIEIDEPSLETYLKGETPEDFVWIGEVVIVPAVYDSDKLIKGSILVSILEAASPICIKKIEMFFDVNHQHPTIFPNEVLGSIGKAFSLQPLPDQTFKSEDGVTHKICKCRSGRSFIYREAQRLYWTYDRFQYVYSVDPLEQRVLIYDVLLD